MIIETARFFPLIFLTIGGSPAHAQDLNEKRCIYASAQKTPPIPSLSIVASKITEKKNLPDGSGVSMQVHLDTKLADTTATLSFVCVAGGTKPTLAEPIGLTR